MSDEPRDPDDGEAAGPPPPDDSFPTVNIEDEVRDRRRRLMDELDRRVAQHSATETVFRIQWTVE